MRNTALPSAGFPHMLRLSAITLLSVAACNCSSAAPPEGEASSERAPAPGSKEAAPSGPPLASKAFYRIDAKTPACSVGATCEATIVLTALAGHKVNDEYPTKFVPAASADWAVEGTPKFTVEGTTRGVMKVQVKPAKAGTVTLEGTFKLSVCTNETCEIDAAKIAVPITAS